jgi:predicted SAM-dependent methyltransferase
MLGSLLKELFSPSRQAGPHTEPGAGVRCVLNVGGGSKTTAIPDYFGGWRHDLLDIDPRGAPEIVCDARELTQLPPGAYDAVYCSHNLEHYYRHDGLKVLRGFLHVLNETGFAEIRVPDIAQVITALNEHRLELDDILYTSPAGPISAHDVIYGFQREIEQTGNDFYAHKTGFSPMSLRKMLLEGGFHKVFIEAGPLLAVHALAFKAEPTSEQYAALRTAWKLEAT